ncbi:MAG: hypothetical protein LBL70_02695 [Treponema sp.]|jgi:hypothetical protein|nr:hypothetical protein [Treponema sp.]
MTITAVGTTIKAIEGIVIFFSSKNTITPIIRNPQAPSITTSIEKFGTVAEIARKPEVSGQLQPQIREI